MAETRPRRQLRSTQACDYCHRRRIRCRSSLESPDRCQNCVDFDLKCESFRPSKRGKHSKSSQTGVVGHGEKPTTVKAHASAYAGSVTSDGSTHLQTHVQTHVQTRRMDMQLQPSHQPLPISTHSAEEILFRPALNEPCEPLGLAWKAFAQASVLVIRQLMDVYFETVYPIFPFFDHDNLKRRLLAGDHLRHRGFFCSVMAACALSSARIRDGALVSPTIGSQDLANITPETFLSAAQDTLPTHFLHARDFDSLRGAALLSIASLQEVEIDAMRMYIGLYFTMNTTWGWHEESNWPADLSLVELEERRRVFWSMYTLDVFTSIVWDGCVHFQEAHAKIQYPSCNQTALDHPHFGSSSWIVGWNFTTDLYRILEHVNLRLRARSSRFNILINLPTSDRASPTEHIEAQVNQLYSTLPTCFKEFLPATGRMDQDIYGFQAANIQATLALLRISLLSLESNAGIDQKCSVVSHVLRIFHKVPNAFQRAISTPLIYHIGGIGNILGSVLEAPLSENSYQRVRALLLSLVELLESLESFLNRRAGAGRRLREQVDLIDSYMISRRHVLDAGGSQDALRGQLTASVEEVSETPSFAMDGSVEGVDGISPVFQIPENLLDQWDYIFNMSQTQFPYFSDFG